MKTTHSFLPFLLALAIIPAGALADDTGRVAVGPNTTPGDASFLYRITQPGSYYLAENVVGIAGKEGIQITAGGVTLDLNGFAVIGTETSVGDGIEVYHTYGQVRIHNGSIRNWSESCIRVETSAIELESLHLSDSSQHGLYIHETPATATVTRCVAEENGRRGFWAVSATNLVVFTECTARNNGSDGYWVHNALLRGCTAAGNGGDGISAARTSISDCTANMNTGNGIMANYVTVSHCTVIGNGANGIRASGATLVTGNQVSLHATGTRAGILVLGRSNRIEDNNVTENAYGISVHDSSNVIARNSARSITKNYQIAAGNRVGTIVVPPPSAVISGNSGGGSGTTDPWSSIAY